MAAFRFQDHQARVRGPVLRPRDNRTSVQIDSRFEDQQQQQDISNIHGESTCSYQPEKDLPRNDSAHLSQ